MHETFRSSKKVKYQGMAFTACYLAAVVAISSVFFLEEPAKHGFKGEHSVAVVGGMGIAVFGSMLLMSIYYWVAYYVERFTIQETMLSIRSMFQDRQFDVSEIESLTWKVFPRGGSIRFQVLGSKARLYLQGYEKHNRLQIIRTLRNLVPPEVQAGWPMFCHKVALPLRDGKPSPIPIERLIDPAAEIITITRSRYDRMLMFGFPLSVVLATGFWAFLNVWQFAVLPLLVIAAWLLFRFHIPQEGRKETRLTSTSQGKGQLIGFSGVIIAQLLMIGLALLGVEKSIACWAAVIVLLVTFPPAIYFLHQSDKQRKNEEKQGAESAPTVWQQKELDHQS